MIISQVALRDGFLSRKIQWQRIQLLSVVSSISPQRACCEFLACVQEKLSVITQTPDYWSFTIMFSYYLWYHIENIYPVISDFRNQISHCVEMRGLLSLTIYYLSVRSPS